MGGTCRDGDQDGNNGCGNDADRDDDNEGWCGKPGEGEVAAAGVEEAEVLGVEFARPQEAEVQGLAVTGTPDRTLTPAGAALLALAAVAGVFATATRVRAR